MGYIIDTSTYACYSVGVSFIEARWSKTMLMEEKIRDYWPKGATIKSLSQLQLVEKEFGPLTVGKVFEISYGEMRRLPGVGHYTICIIRKAALKAVVEWAIV
jgi:hypothetical protein